MSDRSDQTLSKRKNDISFKMRWRRGLTSRRARNAIVFLIACYIVYAYLWKVVLHATWPQIIFQEAPPTRTGPKRILFWTNFFLNPYGPMTHEDFVKTCPVSNCEITNDRTLVEESDAVVFHAIDLMYDINLPKVRYSWQRYVFYLLEAPIRTYLDLKKWPGFFNYTMTFRHDSDAPKRMYVEPVRSQKPKKPRNYAVGKSKMAVWFVSNCLTPSGREELVTALQKYVEVDVYGSCGKFECNVNDHVTCMDMAAQKYKFYLSLENSLCRDYVTEKFLYPLQYDIVPITYGGANYSQIAPPHSFIDALNFTDAKELANYLHFLDKNDDFYNAYFAWKGKHEVRRGDEWCELCEKLNGDDPPKVYEDIHDWWFEQGKCFSKNWVSGLESASIYARNAWKDMLSGAWNIVQNSGVIAKDIVGKH